MKLSFAVFLSLCGALPSLGSDVFLPYLTQDSAAITPSPDAAPSQAFPPMPIAPLVRQLSDIHDASPIATQSPIAPSSKTGFLRGALKRPRTGPKDIYDFPPSAPSSPAAEPSPKGSSPVVSVTPQGETPSQHLEEIPLGQPSQESVEGPPLERSDRIQSFKPEDQLLEAARRIILSGNIPKALEAIEALKEIMETISSHQKAGNSSGDEHG